MVSFLDGPLAAAIHKGFKGKLLTGTLFRKSYTGSVNSAGDRAEGTPKEYPFEGMVESFSAVFMAQAGIPDTDVKIMIIANSIAVEPNNDDIVQFTANTQKGKYQIRKILEIDPARATFTCQGFSIK